jgi:hypothetical protein
MLPALAAWTFALAGCGGLTSSGAGNGQDASTDSTSDGRRSSSDASDASMPDGSTADRSSPCGTACSSSGWCAASPSPTGNGLTSVWTSGANDVWVAAGPAALHWDGSTWENFDTGTQGFSFSALSGTGPSDVWATAVGVDGSSAILHWSGAAWSVSFSVPKGTDEPVGIWASASNDVWAVGGALIEHFDGISWSTITSIGGSSFAHLSAIWGSGRDDLWAVGGAVSSDPAVILHWNGKSWSFVASPAFDSPYFHSPYYLTAVWGTGPADVWSVGADLSYDAVAIHWDGLHWSAVDGLGALGAPLGAAAVWGSSSSDVWIVGPDFDGRGPGGIAHWNGAKWSSVATPTTPALRAITGTSATDAWAVGDLGVLLHWNGTAWASESNSSLPSPNLVLDSVWSSSGRDVWMGSVSESGSPQLEHWDGTAWSTSPVHGAQDIPFSSKNCGKPMGRTLEVVALWGSGSGDVWAAVGDVCGASFAHWDGVVWSVSAQPPTGYIEDAFGPPVSLWGSGPRDIWAVNTTVPALHWNGSTWRSWTSTTSTVGSAVWGNASDDVWIVNGPDSAGLLGNNVAGSTIVHWDGADWAPAFATPDALGAVWGAGKDDVWAAGTTFQPYAAGPWLVVAYHWDGVSWSRYLSRVSTINAEPTPMFGNGSNDVWIGAPGFGRTPGLLHWDGSTWSAVPSITEYGWVGIAGAGGELFAVASERGSGGAAIICRGQLTSP